MSPRPAPDAGEPSREEGSGTPGPAPGAPGDPERRKRRARGKAIAAALLALTLVIRCATLGGEVAHPGGMLNDMVLHDAAIRSASRALGRLENPLDGWLSPISVGYPFLRQYQPAAHVAAAAVHRATGGAASPFAVRALLVALALAAFPLAVYRCARDLGLDRVAAACAGALSPLLEAPLLLGLADQAYLWRGFGLFTQALAAPLFVLSIGAARRALDRGRGGLRAGLLLGATLVTHFIFGWLAAWIAGALALHGSAPWRARAVRLARIGAVAAAVSAFILVPAVRTAAYANQSAIEPAIKWLGYPLGEVLGWTASGRLLDGDPDGEARGFRAARYPVASILAGAGLALALAAAGIRACRAIRPRSTDVEPPAGLPPARAAIDLLAILALSVFLLTIRAHVPSAGDWIPGAKHLHLQRMIAGVHLAALLLGGVALGALAARVRAVEGPGQAAAFGAVALFALGPAILERIEFCGANATWAREAEEGIARDGALGRLLDRIEAGPPGRLYAGHDRFPALETKLARGVQVHAAAIARDIPAIGKLWHPFALAGDLAYFHLRPEREEDLDLFSVRWVLYPPGARPPPGGIEVERAGGLVLYERPRAAWFRLASAPRRIDADRASALGQAERWFSGPERAAGVAPLLALRGERWAPGGPPNRAPRGRIEREAVGEGTFEAEVALEEPGYVVAAIGYHPALGARVDGAAREVACVVPGFAAVAVGPGDRRVEIFVAPDRLRLFLALAGAAAIAVPAAIERRRRAREITPKP